PPRSRPVDGGNGSTGCWPRPRGTSCGERPPSLEGSARRPPLACLGCPAFRCDGPDRLLVGPPEVLPSQHVIDRPRVDDPVGREAGPLGALAAVPLPIELTGRVRVGVDR